MRCTPFLALIAITASAGCSRAPVLTISNRSPQTVINVVVSGTGFTQSVGNIAPGAEQRVSLSPRGESGVRIAFDASGKRVDSGEQGYFESSGGYRVKAIIETNLNVTITSDLGGY